MFGNAFEKDGKAIDFKDWPRFRREWSEEQKCFLLIPLQAPKYELPPRKRGHPIMAMTMLVVGVALCLFAPWWFAPFGIFTAVVGYFWFRASA